MQVPQRCCACSVSALWMWLNHYKGFQVIILFFKCTMQVPQRCPACSVSALWVWLNHYKGIQVMILC